MKKILLDDSLITGRRVPAMKDPNWHEVNESFEFKMEDKIISVHNVDIYWESEDSLIERLKKYSRLFDIEGAYATIGNGIVMVNNGKEDNKIRIQIHAY